MDISEKMLENSQKAFTIGRKKALELFNEIKLTSQNNKKQIHEIGKVEWNSEYDYITHAYLRKNHLVGKFETLCDLLSRDKILFERDVITTPKFQGNHIPKQCQINFRLIINPKGQ